MINKEIFKSYDIRGIYPDDLNEQAAFAIGKAFAKLISANPSISLRAPNVVVGYDARLSSPALFNALTRGLYAGGLEIASIGQTPTEGLYFAAGSYDFDAAIMITASHNPKEYNGFKMLARRLVHRSFSDGGSFSEGGITRQGKDLTIIRGKDLLLSVQEENFNQDSNVKFEQKDIWNDYLDLVLSFFSGMGNKKIFKIVVDASNGVIGNVIEMLKEKLPCKIIPLNFEPDGNFPNHSPNPLDAGASDQIAKKIKAEKADFGFMFDGDADRIFLVDEKGQLVSADITLLLLAKHFLQKNPGMGIAYNLICSRVVPELVKKWGGVPIRTQVGVVNVRQGLLDHNGIMGGELSAHYCFADYFYMDSGVIAFLTLLQIIAKEDKPVSEIVKELSIYAPPFQQNFKIKNIPAVLEKVKEKYSDAKQDFLDGITVEYEHWWFNLRPSNTEPLLKLTIEADTQELLEEKKGELSESIKTQ